MSYLLHENLNVWREFAHRFTGNDCSRVLILIDYADRLEADKKALLEALEKIYAPISESPTRTARTSLSALKQARAAIKQARKP